MGMFSGVENAKNNKSGNHFPANARGKVKLTGVKVISSAQKGVNYFVIEGKVTESSTHPDIVGTERSNLVDMSKPSALSNVRAFVAACLGKPFDEVDESDCEGIVEREVTKLVNGQKTKTIDPSPAINLELAWETTTVKTRKGTDFTKINWSSVEG